MTPKDLANEYAAWVLENCDHALSSDEINKLEAMFAAALKRAEEAEASLMIATDKGLDSIADYIRVREQRDAFRQALEKLKFQSSADETMDASEVYKVCVKALSGTREK